MGIEQRFPMPDVDIFVHTGDATDNGTDEELRDYVQWLREISHKFKHMLVIPGNHDWYGTRDLVDEGRLDPVAVLRPGFMKRKLRAFGLPDNCQVLDHEEVTVMG